MEIVRSLDHENASPVGWAARAILVGAEGSDLTERRLAGVGVQVERTSDIYTAMSTVMDDPGLENKLPLGAQRRGGVAEVRRTVKLMGETMLRVPVILVSAECGTQVFALERHEPTVLRAPLSAVSMRVGFEHVMRDRMQPRFI